MPKSRPKKTTFYRRLKEYSLLFSDVTENNNVSINSEAASSTSSVISKCSHEPEVEHVSVSDSFDDADNFASFTNSSSDDSSSDNDNQYTFNSFHTDEKKVEGNLANELRHGPLLTMYPIKVCSISYKFSTKLILTYQKIQELF
ncbi:hypothetical protein TcasGA2_TC004288 [Tribolium castaneum]|uniref:Uncharacterized protein n=1 Tax=Tribolium castaneum TaxID=7070 RepID=D7EK35_TRICA|nr:hypothetical protein TcasGA2_TC004288 [Tribolium castaneum]